jgi:hypothetical protein
MDMSALNAQIDKLLIQTTTRDASHKLVINQTASLEPEKTATTATSAQRDTSQMPKEPSVIESSQDAAALRSMTHPDMSVFHAQHTKLPPTETKDVSQDNAQDSTKFLDQLRNAMHAKNAKRDLPQTTLEEDASDTSQLHAHATKDSIKTDSVVLTAQPVPDHLLITEAVSALTVTQIRS